MRNFDHATISRLCACLAVVDKRRLEEDRHKWRDDEYFFSSGKGIFL